MTKFWTMPKRDGGMPRDQQGWRVAPAPDGRGMPDPPTPRPPHRSRPFVWFVVLLLAFNLISALLIRPGIQPRVSVPFSPYFVSAVREGQVASVATKGDTIEATFKVALRYPAQSAAPGLATSRGHPTTRYSRWNERHHD